MKEPKCPECDKLHGVRDQSQSIGQFIEWLQEKGIVFAKSHVHTDACHTLGYSLRGFRKEYRDKVRKGSFSGEYRPVCTKEELHNGAFNKPQCGMTESTLYPEQVPIEKTLAEFFEIDLNKVEREKLRLLDFIRDKRAVDDMRKTVPRLSTTPA